MKGSDFQGEFWTTRLAFTWRVDGACMGASATSQGTQGHRAQDRTIAKGSRGHNCVKVAL